MKVVVQFSSAAMWGIEPTKFKPDIEDACCSTLNVTPAIVKLPERAAPELAAACIVNVPEPEPEALPVKVIHDGGLVAVQGHPEFTETLTEPEPPTAREALAAVIERVIANRSRGLSDGHGRASDGDGGASGSAAGRNWRDHQRDGCGAGSR